MFSRRGPNLVKAAAEERRKKSVVKVAHHRKVQFEGDEQVYEYNSASDASDSEVVVVDGVKKTKVKMHEVSNAEHHFAAVNPDLLGVLEAENPDLARKVVQTVEKIKVTRHPKFETGLAPDGDGYKLKLLGDKGDARVFSNTTKVATRVSCSADLRNVGSGDVEECGDVHPEAKRYVLTVFTAHDAAGHVGSGKSCKRD